MANDLELLKKLRDSIKAFDEAKEYNDHGKANEAKRLAEIDVSYYNEKFKIKREKDAIDAKISTDRRKSEAIESMYEHRIKKRERVCCAIAIVLFVIVIACVSYLLVKGIDFSALVAYCSYDYTPVERPDLIYGFAPAFALATLVVTLLCALVGIIFHFSSVLFEFKRYMFFWIAYLVATWIVLSVIWSMFGPQEYPQYYEAKEKIFTTVLYPVALIRLYFTNLKVTELTSVWTPIFFVLLATYIILTALWVVVNWLINIRIKKEQSDVSIEGYLKRADIVEAAEKSYKEKMDKLERALKAKTEEKYKSLADKDTAGPAQVALDCVAALQLPKSDVELDIINEYISIIEGRYAYDLVGAKNVRSERQHRDRMEKYAEINLMMEEEHRIKMRNIERQRNEVYSAIKDGITEMKYDADRRAEEAEKARSEFIDTAREIERSTREIERDLNDLKYRD